KPFVSFQAVHYRQGSYSETGAYDFGQAVDSGSSTYTAATVGWDLARDFGKDGYMEFEIGLMQTLGGDNPSYSARLVGGGEKFTIRGASMDKTRVVVGVYGSQAINDRWRIGGEVALAQGAHDQDVTASLSLRFSW
ncbi:MAG: autotransporter outer membrane beta-barrel domain-containing protein, partial [Schwartzia sp.]|nr:autotransporter outer membrane beta-barrel domain-containing protein [Schwartzia sp. (in: firmicutes)]